MAWLWLEVPHLGAAAARLQQALPAGAPLVVAEGERVRDCGLELQARGVRPGLTLREARTRCPEAHVAAWDAGQVAALWGRLHARLRRLGPTLESHPWQALALATPRRPAEALVAAQQALAEARTLAVPVQAGWAVGRFTATVAARLVDPGEACLVTPGYEADLLSALPLSWLPLSEEALAELGMLGLATVGDFARLPVAAIGTRLGRAGLEAWRLARGEERPRPALPEPEPDLPRRHAAFEPPLEWDGSLAGALRRALERLGAELERCGLACHELRLVLVGEAGRVWRAASAPHEPPGTPAGMAALAGPLLAGVEAAGGERVAALQLAARRTGARTSAQPGLFPVAGAGWARVAEELAGRFPGCFWRGRRLDPAARLACERAAWQPWRDPEAR